MSIGRYLKTRLAETFPTLPSESIQPSAFAVGMLRDVVEKKVREAGTCKPIPHAVLEIWQPNGQGVYEFGNFFLWIFFFHAISEHADGGRRGAGSNRRVASGRVLARHVFGYLQIDHRSSAFAVGMLRDVVEKKGTSSETTSASAA